MLVTTPRDKEILQGVGVSTLDCHRVEHVPEKERKPGKKNSKNFCVES